MRWNLTATRCVVSVVAILLAGGVQSHSVAGLIGYWDFEDSAADRSGNGLDGTLIGDAAYSADVPSVIASSSSVLLDGDGDWIALGNPGELNFSSNDWTVAGWMNTTRTGLGDENEGTLFGNGGSMSNMGVLLAQFVAQRLQVVSHFDAQFGDFTGRCRNRQIRISLAYQTVRLTNTGFQIAEDLARFMIRVLAGLKAQFLCHRHFVAQVFSLALNRLLDMTPTPNLIIDFIQSLVPGQQLI